MTPTKFVLPDVTIAVANIGTDESPAFLAYPLTPCCGASGKGSSNAGSGVVCRSCYREVDAMYGDCAPLYEVPGSWPIERILGGWTDLDDAALVALVNQVKAVAA